MSYLTKPQKKNKKTKEQLPLAETKADWFSQSIYKYWIIDSDLQVNFFYFDIAGFRAS